MAYRNDYVPIDCDVHDKLEAFATTHRRVHLVMASDAGAELSADGVIADIYTAPSKEEFLKLEDGTSIRLDRIRACEPVS